VWSWVQKIVKDQFDVPASFGTDPFCIWYGVNLAPICNTSLNGLSAADFPLPLYRLRWISDSCIIPAYVGTTTIMLQNAPSEHIYKERIKQRIALAIGRGDITLESICRASEGASPLDVLSAIADLKLSLEPASIEETTRKHVRSTSSLPEPHPIDFEWRFNETTARHLAEHAHQLGGRVACLGTPTVFRHLHSHNPDPVLIDRNPFLYRYLATQSHRRIVLADLRFSISDLAVGTFDVILMDPPWYGAHVETWLVRALEIAHPGTVIILTLFPRLVRLHAAEERKRLIKALRGLGTLARLRFKAIYETPLFESATLQALGIPPLVEWRAADLVRIAVSDPLPKCRSIAPEEPTWHRFLVKDQVIALRTDAPQNGVPSIYPVYEDSSFVLRSVSARESIRDTIDLWTSRNRCARVSGTEHLRHILIAVERAQSLGLDPRLYEGTGVAPETLNTLATLLQL
jgi:hypothetical protein